MGHEIEKLALLQGHRIAGIIDSQEQWLQQPNAIASCDVIIDFSVPDKAFENINHALEAHKPIVCGATGWFHLLDEVKMLCQQKQGAVFYSPNFSLGVNLFLKINNQLARLMGQYPAYEAKIEEIHHTRKLDAPSGTAILIAEQMLENYPLKTDWSLGEAASPTHLPVYAERIGDVPGTHTVSYTSFCDQIVFKHEAFNRQGFASGALAAAQWLLGKQGVFSMSDLLGDWTMLEFMGYKAQFV